MRRDLIKRLGNIAVADIMTTDVITIAPDATMEELVRLFKESDVEGIPVVVREKYLVGMAYLRDLLQLYFLPKYSLSDPGKVYALRSVLTPDRPVREFMDAEPVIVQSDARVSHLAYLMMQNGVYKVPVEDPPLWLANLLEEVHPAGTKWVFYCQRICWATVPEPETHMARVPVLAAVGSHPVQGACAAHVALTAAVEPASEGFCVMTPIPV